MTAIAQWYEDNGQPTGVPARGTTRNVAARSDFKSVDDSTTDYRSARIIAGQNSYHKYKFVRFTGSFNEISAGKFAHTSGALGTGVTLVAKATSTYQAPTTQPLSAAQNISTVTSANAGFSVQFSVTGPEGVSSPTLTAPGYSQYIAMQLQTTAAAAAGDIGNKITTLQWNEN